MRHRVYVLKPGVQLGVGRFEVVDVGHSVVPDVGHTQVGVGSRVGPLVKTRPRGEWTME